MPSLDERMMETFYNWLVNKKGWFKIMLPILFILIWINIVTDGLNCDLNSVFQTKCDGQYINSISNQNKLGACGVNEDCEEICNIWSKTRTKGSLVPSNNVEYKCFEGQCECNNYIENCHKGGITCPWSEV